jgi:hypothetical protein
MRKGPDISAFAVMLGKKYNFACQTLAKQLTRSLPAVSNSATTDLFSEENLVPSPSFHFFSGSLMIKGSFEGKRSR